MHIRATVITALFAPLIASGAYIAVPIGPIPITLQSLFIISAGLVGGRRIGVSAVGVYLLAGAVGLPVFSGGTGGLAHLIGPTGGFLLGAFPAVFISGLFSDLSESIDRGQHEEMYERRTFTMIALLAIGALCSTLILYLAGVPWLKIALGLTWERAIALGMMPFLPGDTLKLIAAVSLGIMFKKRVINLLSGGVSHESP